MLCACVQVTQVTQRHFSVRADNLHVVWATVSRRAVNKMHLVRLPGC